MYPISTQRKKTKHKTQEDFDLLRTVEGIHTHGTFADFTEQFSA